MPVVVQKIAADASSNCSSDKLEQSDQHAHPCAGKSTRKKRDLRKKVLIVTDSLGFPRHEPELLLYEDTYIGLLKANYPQIDFIHQGYGGATLRELFQQTTYFHRSLDPDLVIMQSGVVDCAPRALTRIEQHVVANLPILKRWLVPLVKRHSNLLRRVRHITYMTPRDFALCAEKFESEFKQVHWLGIIPACQEWECRVPGITRQISIFNDILSARQYVPTSDLKADAMMSDLHHPNALGHRKIFDLLAPIIVRLLA